MASAIVSRSSQYSARPGTLSAKGRARKFPPLVSVIIVVYNGAHCLEAALQSVLSQDPTLVECIVIDGGSRDGTIPMLERYDAEIDLWQSEPDRGIYDAMNKGAALARGRFLYFLGADDVMLAKVSELRQELTDSSTVYYGNVLWTSPHRVYDGPFTGWKLARRNICHQAIYYPTHLVRQWKFNTEYRMLADWEFNLKCFSDKGVRLQYLPHTIAMYNMEGASANQRDDAFERDRTALYRRYLPLPVYLLHLLRKNTRRVLRAFKSGSAPRPA